MTVLLTSFRRWHEDNDALVDWWHESTGWNVLKAYSIAVYQPNWYRPLPTLRTFDIRQDSKWTRPRDFIPEDHEGEPDPELLQRYHDALVDLYWSRRNDRALATLFTDTYDVALCCWCPYDTAAKRQLDTFGSFVCHSWPVETVLKRWGVDVRRDEDRDGEFSGMVS